MSPDLKVGDILVPDEIIKIDPKIKELSQIHMDKVVVKNLKEFLLEQYKNVFDLSLVTQSQIVATKNDKNMLFQNTKAQAVDMEAFEVMRAAQEVNLTCATVKVIIDDLENDLPPFNREYVSKGELTPASTAKIIDSSENKESFIKNLKTGANVLNQIAPKVASFVECYWSQCQC